MTVARADLASAVREALEGRVEILFGDTVDALDDDGDRVHVRFRNENPRDFDLVVGPMACTHGCAR